MDEASRHSGEIADLISAPPSWMMRWGVTVFLVTLVIIGGLSFYIRYPDVVRGAAVVCSGDAAVPVSDFFGKVAISQREIIKIQKGQRVVIKLHRYPFEDFGVVRGVVYSIGELPESDGSFTLKIIFKKPFPRGIILKERLTGDAEIILQDRSLMDRLLNNILGEVSGK